MQHHLVNSPTTRRDFLRRADTVLGDRGCARALELLAARGPRLSRRRDGALRGRRHPRAAPRAGLRAPGRLDRSLAGGALGDAGNIAFHLESATKMLGKDIVMSESAYRHLPEVFWKDHEQHIKVKGRRDPIRICGCDFSTVDKLIEKVR